MTFPELENIPETPKTSAGPWRLVFTPEGDFGIVSPARKHIIATAHATNVADADEALANARLMAAAPELFHLSLLLLGFIVDGDNLPDSIVESVVEGLAKRVTEVMNKATGL